jgi:hypothetical protein
MTGVGVFDYRTSRGIVTYEFSGRPAWAALTGMQILFTGAAVYVHPPESVMTLPEGKYWVAAGSSPLNPTEGVPDPSQLLTSLRALGEVIEIGEESLAGAPTTHYRAVIDLDRLEEIARSEGRTKDAEAAVELMESTGLNRLPTDIWVDSSGLVRRQTLHLQASAEGVMGVVDLRADYYDFGVKVKVEPPSPDEVVTKPI